MAVRKDDAMTAEGRRQRTRARRRHWMCDPELLDGGARPGHLTCEPALAARRHVHHALHSRGLQVQAGGCGGAPCSSHRSMSLAPTRMMMGL